MQQLYDAAKGLRAWVWPPQAVYPVYVTDLSDMKKLADHSVKMRRWAVRITYVNLGMAAMWTLLVAWILGWLPMWVPQPAYAIDLAPFTRENQKLQTQLVDLQTQIQRNDIGLRLGQLTPDIDAALDAYCRAQAAVRAGRAPQEMATLYLGKLRDLEEQYRRLTSGEAYQRETCDSIIIPLVPTP